MMREEERKRIFRSVIVERAIQEKAKAEDSSARSEQSRHKIEVENNSAQFTKVAKRFFTQYRASQHADAKRQGSKYILEICTTVGVALYTAITVGIFVFGIVQYSEIHRFNKKQASIMSGQLQAMEGQLNEMRTQSDIQKQTLESAYRPRIVLSSAPAPSGDFTVTDKTASGGIAIQYRNVGNMAAEDVEWWIELWPIGAALAHQAHVCNVADLYQRMRLDNNKKANLPLVFGTIPENSAPNESTWTGLPRDIDDFRPPKSAAFNGIMPAFKNIVPAFVGCAVYRADGRDTIYHTRFIFRVEPRMANGKGHDFMSVDPQTYKAESVDLLYWPDGNNSD